MNEALGLLETGALTPALAAIDAMEKCAGVRVWQSELNDLAGVSVKILGRVADVQAAIGAGIAAAQLLGDQPQASILPAPDAMASRAIESPAQYNPLIEQETVFFPQCEAVEQPKPRDEVRTMPTPAQALGFIETQGFTAVFEAIDTACKVANVEVIAKEKLGGGFITVVIAGDLAAVTAAVEAGSQKVEGLGKLVAAHVLARPSKSVLGLLPKLS